MKADIDRLMQEYKLDAIVVMGGREANAYHAYLTGRSKAQGIIIKRRGETPVFIVGGMEVDEAGKTGLKVMTNFEFDYAETWKQYGDQPRVFQREMFLNYFRKLGITGRVGFYGVADVGSTLPQILALQDSTLNVEVVIGGDEVDLFSKAYETKDAKEIESLREAAKLTSEVVRRTRDYISQHYASGDAVGSPVVDASGKPLTIGDVKRFIRVQENELGLEDADCIFAQGRDAAIPHNHGEDSDVLAVGKTIVFDIYPRTQSGYFHDMTRTWVLGHAPAEVQAIYDQVYHIFRQVRKSYQTGQPTSKYQVMVLDYYESQGHKTQRSHPGTMEGYVHSLGHGLGLNIHEAPSFGEKAKYTIQPGNVYTIEPGLYYPERGIGVRVEDTVIVNENGSIETLTDFPYDLVVPLKKKS